MPADQQADSGQLAWTGPRSQHTCPTTRTHSFLSTSPPPPLSILPLASSLPLPPAIRTSGQLFPAVPDGERSPHFRTSLQPIHLSSPSVAAIRQRHCNCSTPAVNEKRCYAASCTVTIYNKTRRYFRYTTSQTTENKTNQNRKGLGLRQNSLDFKAQNSHVKNLS